MGATIVHLPRHLRPAVNDYALIIAGKCSVKTMTNLLLFLNDIKSNYKHENHYLMIFKNFL